MHKVCYKTDTVLRRKKGCTTNLNIAEPQSSVAGKCTLQLHINVYSCKCVLCNKFFTFAVTLKNKETNKKQQGVLQTSITSSPSPSSLICTLPIPMFSLPAHPLCNPISQIQPYSSFWKCPPHLHTHPLIPTTCAMLSPMFKFPSFFPFTKLHSAF